MERCKEKQGFSNTEFPDVIPGDTVENKNGDVYLVIHNHERDGLLLVAPEDGRYWDSNNLWGGGDPSDWKQVECCFMIKE